MSDFEKIVKERVEEEKERIIREQYLDKVLLLNAIKERFGDEVIDIVEKVEAKRARNDWAKIAANQGEKNTIEDFIKLFWEPLRSEGFQFMIEHKDNGVLVKCTKCPLYYTARAVRGAEWGYHLICSTDPHIIEAFNPQIGFRRTKTLMQKHGCCEHFYYMKDKCSDE